MSEETKKQIIIEASIFMTFFILIILAVFFKWAFIALLVLGCLSAIASLAFTMLCVCEDEDYEINIGKKNNNKK